MSGWLARYILRSPGPGIAFWRHSSIDLASKIPSVPRNALKIDPSLNLPITALHASLLHFLSRPTSLRLDLQGHILHIY
jgi:hypothetical protein